MSELTRESYSLGREIDIDEALLIVRRATFDPGQFTKRVLYAHDLPALQRLDLVPTRSTTAGRRASRMSPTTSARSWRGWGSTMGELRGRSQRDGLTGREIIVQTQSGPAVRKHPGPDTEGVIFDAR